MTYHDLILKNLTCSEKFPDHENDQQLTSSCLELHGLQCQEQIVQEGGNDNWQTQPRTLQETTCTDTSHLLFSHSTHASSTVVCGASQEPQRKPHQWWKLMSSPSWVFHFPSSQTKLKQMNLWSIRGTNEGSQRDCKHQHHRNWWFHCFLNSSDHLLTTTKDSESWWRSSWGTQGNVLILLQCERFHSSGIKCTEDLLMSLRLHRACSLPAWTNDKTKI